MTVQLAFQHGVKVKRVEGRRAGESDMGNMEGGVFHTISIMITMFQYLICIARLLMFYIPQ
jgi:hypothetical protein